MNCKAVNSVNDLNFLFKRADSEWLDACCDQHKDEGFLIGHCLPLILGEARSCANDVPRILCCANALNRLTAILCQFLRSLPPFRQSQVVDLCLHLLDFPADSVGFQAAATLANLFELHQLSCGRSFQSDNFDSSTLFPSSSSADHSNKSPNLCCDWPLSIGLRLTSSNCQNGENIPIISKQRAKAMQTLLQMHPELRYKLMTEELLANLYRQMENAPLASQLSHLIADDISASLSAQNGSGKRLEFHVQSIRQQLLAENVHPRSRQAIEKKLLPTLLRSPESKAWFLAEFPSFIDFSLSSAHSQRALCYLLRLAIQHTNGYRDDNALSWMDLLQSEENAEKTMRRALESHDFETRLSAWSLLCSHPKGAQPIGLIEVKLAKQFIRTNLMQLGSPSARQAIFYQLEKLLSRMREHSKSLLKLLKNEEQQQQKEELEQQIGLYRDFFHWLHQLAFQWIAAPDWHQKLMENLANQQEERHNLEDGVDIGGINLTNDEPEPATDGIEEEGGSNDDENDEEEEEEEEGNVPFNARISALTLLSQLYQMGAKNAEEDPLTAHIGLWRCIGPNEWSKLRQALDDRYEVCQSIALNLLNHFWSAEGQRRYPELVPLHSGQYAISGEEWAFLLACPHMPRHQQALEYRLRFLLPQMDPKLRATFVENLLEKAENSCAKAAKMDDGKQQQLLLSLIRSPQLHALLAALHAALPFVGLNFQQTKQEHQDSLLDRTISLCHLAADLISPVVHSMSPEGFLPGPRREEDEVSFFHAQQLARTCFRAHKAISGIFAAIIQAMPSPTALPAEQLERIGCSYFWKQLTECRHRGAFEAAAESFQIVCRRFWQFAGEREDFPCDPGKWIRQIMDGLTGKNVLQRFCVTRRSAGLPHLISTILETHNCDERMFNGTIGQLLGCRQLPEPELEVHCVNVLRLLFANSHFAELVLPHVETAFHITLSGSTSEFWPVRNAYTQLFAALIKRVFGTPVMQQRSLHIQPRCKQSAHEFFTRYSSLYTLLLTQLAKIAKRLEEKTLGSGDFLLSFPILIILTHLRPVAHVQNNFPLCPFLPNLLQLMLSFPSSSHRELASAAILSIALPTEIERIVGWLAGISFQPTLNLIDGVRIFISHIEELGVPSNVEKLRKWLDGEKLQRIECYVGNNSHSL